MMVVVLKNPGAPDSRKVFLNVFDNMFEKKPDKSIIDKLDYDFRTDSGRRGG